MTTNGAAEGVILDSVKEARTMKYTVAAIIFNLLSVAQVHAQNSAEPWVTVSSIDKNDFSFVLDNLGAAPVIVSVYPSTKRGPLGPKRMNEEIEADCAKATATLSQSATNGERYRYFVFPSHPFPYRYVPTETEKDADLIIGCVAYASSWPEIHATGFYVTIHSDTVVIGKAQ